MIGKAYSWQNCRSGNLPQGTAVITYNYDEGTNGIGDLTSLTDDAGSATYGFDILGRMASENRTIGGVTKSVSYTYNLDGSVATMTYPNGAVLTYTPDFSRSVGVGRRCDQQRESDQLCHWCKAQARCDVTQTEIPYLILKLRARHIHS